MSRFNRNTRPFWLKSKYGGKCSNPRCGRGVKKGEDIFYYPATRTFLCNYEPCGQQAERDLKADDFDQAQMSGSW